MKQCQYAHAFIKFAKIQAMNGQLWVNLSNDRGGEKVQILQIYWTQVICFLHDEMGSPMVLDPKVYLLVLLSDAEVDKFQATFIYETLILAWKAVAGSWMQALPPTMQKWKRDINATLPFKKNDLYA